MRRVAKNPGMSNHADSVVAAGVSPAVEPGILIGGGNLKQAERRDA
jgi:hypothetical protein